MKLCIEYIFNLCVVCVMVMHIGALIVNTHPFCTYVLTYRQLQQSIIGQPIIARESHVCLL
jgi:hypothetical protein